MKACLLLLGLLGLAAHSFGFDTAQPVTATAITAVPFSITHSGNYYLATDLISTAPGVAISIAADQVTLDLNERSLVAKGPAAQPNIGVGIAVFNRREICVQNGHIDSFGQAGIILDATDKKREHNTENIVRNVRFDGDQIGVLTVSGSINLIERCLFEQGAVGVEDIASLGGDRIQYCEFQDQLRRESVNLGVGILSTPGAGVLCEDNLLADCQDAGIIEQGVRDRLRFNTFVNNGATHIGGLSLGLADN